MSDINPKVTYLFTVTDRDGDKRKVYLWDFSRKSPERKEDKKKR